MLTHGLEISECQLNQLQRRVTGDNKTEILGSCVCPPGCDLIIVCLVFGRGALRRAFRLLIKRNYGTMNQLNGNQSCLNDLQVVGG
jgi:hypothetical protein